MPTHVVLKLHSMHSDPLTRHVINMGCMACKPKERTKKRPSKPNVSATHTCWPCSMSGTRRNINTERETVKKCPQSVVGVQTPQLYPNGTYMAF